MTLCIFGSWSQREVNSNSSSFSSSPSSPKGWKSKCYKLQETQSAWRLKIPTERCCSPWHPQTSSSAGDENTDEHVDMTWRDGQSILRGVVRLLESVSQANTSASNRRSWFWNHSVNKVIGMCMETSHPATCCWSLIFLKMLRNFQYCPHNCLLHPCLTIDT